MNRLINGTQYRATQNGFVAVKCKRSIFFIGTSINQSNKFKELLSSESFNLLFNKGKKARLLGNSISYINL